MARDPECVEFSGIRATACCRALFSSIIAAMLTRNFHQRSRYGCPGIRLPWRSRGPNARPAGQVCLRAPWSRNPHGAHPGQHSPLRDEHVAWFRLSVLFLVLVISLFLTQHRLMALPVAGLYSQEVVVANQSDQERRRAFREAFAAVVTKVTGEPRWIEHAAIVQALDDAQSYVEAIEYSTRLQPADAAAEATPADPLTQLPVAPAQVEQEVLVVSFARGLFDRLLADSGIPVWDSNRPSVLVWMALQDDSGARTLLSPETDRGIMGLMQEFAQARGLPILFPVLDFEDRRTLTADMIWTLDEQAIARASRRYAPDSILAGRLYFSASGDLVGLWQFQFQDRVEVFDSLDTELVSYINAPLNRITSQLASHYAVVPSGGGQGTARLRIEGINSLASYAELLAYLDGLVLVDAVSLSTLQGSVLELTLSLQGSQQQLAELLNLDRNLSPLNPAELERPQVLAYRWIR